MSAAKRFLSTLPVRGATCGALPRVLPRFISIHAPREGSDPIAASRSGRLNDFYPRSP